MRQSLMKQPSASLPIAMSLTALALVLGHAAMFGMFLDHVLGAIDTPFDYLEIGPGHGLMMALAAGSPQVRSLEAWDVSSVSLQETRTALSMLGVTMPVKLMEVDISEARAPADRYDVITISEVLEHLEAPQQALALLRQVLRPGGRIFINVPLNSPSPDHIYLFSHPDEVIAMVEAAGLRMIAIDMFATQGRDIATSLAHRISISTGIIAVPA